MRGAWVSGNGCRSIAGPRAPQSHFPSRAQKCTPPRIYIIRWPYVGACSYAFSHRQGCIMSITIASMSRLCLALTIALLLTCAASAKPNILIIVGDDMGYGDIGVHGCKDIPTPHIDSIAKSGVRCTNGYVSAPQCSPTRAGLMTGRYQQRFGHEHNQAYGGALALTEVTLADRLKAAGYVTGL